MAKILRWLVLIVLVVGGVVLVLRQVFPLPDISGRAYSAALHAIMHSGTVSQVMSHDFDLERVMVEAGQ